MAWRFLLAGAALQLATTAAEARVIYQQPHNGSNVIRQSSWWDPDGSDWDIFTWEDFVLAESTAITEIQWRGGFIYGGSFGGPVVGFTIALYPSIAAGTQPDVVHPPLVEYQFTGNAGQAPAGTFGGVAMYDYHYVLPSPFQALAGARYWVYILAWQHGTPEWGFAVGSGGNGYHFRRLSDYMFQNMPGDLAFTLLASDAATYAIDASAEPADFGVVLGAGAYPAGSLVSLSASPYTGRGFVNWTEAGLPVSNSATYQFTADRDRTLTAHFTNAFLVSSAAAPVYGGTTTGAGWYNAGASVTVSAVEEPGFAFVNWTEFGTPVSDQPDYTFVSESDRTLVANFSAGAGALLFDFNSGPLHTSFPIDLTVAGLTAHFSATGGGYSIQRADTMGFAPWGFDGYCVYPNSVFAADLLVSFSQPITDFSILYSPQELGCDDTATMRVTAYVSGKYLGFATANAPSPGTWPTGTLRIQAPGGFDSVVVHYQARPPTCQDWGPIFLADNMIVTPLSRLTGDLNCDGVVTVGDIGGFVLALTDPGGYLALFPDCDMQLADVNGDGQVSVGDIGSFVLLLTG